MMQAQVTVCRMKVQDTGVCRLLERKKLEAGNFFTDIVTISVLKFLINRKGNQL